MTEKLGRYEILEKIGQGGFAVVYRAHDRQLDRLVALKELRPMLLADPDSIKDFRREARNIARLDHPHVVTIYDVYEVQQRLFIVMQLVDGSSLAELIGKRGRLSWSETVEMITAVAAGLDYAHTRGVLHRDLKPANILLDSNHGPMLSDFGLAKLIGEASTNVTAAGGVVGTPHYIAPEVWEGQGTTRQSDIYALGCILYEMLTGEKPFPGETPPAAMMAHFRPLVLPNTWPEGVPSGVADVFTTALAQKPADRYATAAEMAEVLTTLVKSELATPQHVSARPETKPVSPPILTTKLYIPPIRPELVSRPRLIQRLNEGPRSGRKLTLLSAPAGFGKTTLVSDWLRQLDVPAAWVSLDESDNDPVRFLTYFVAALGTIEASIGKGVLSAIQSPQPPPIEAVLTSLLNEIAALPDRIILVLDDYHLIEAQAIHDALTFLLEHLPLQMHLVIATREDPHLPLARLRARGQLIELRATDLRFTAAETAEFLNQVMGLDLSAADTAALETRTEGWIAGLQLAAISMRGQKDAVGFIKSFTGSHHYVLDYLMEEVLERQPDRVQTFLLQTAVLDRLCGPLCDAVLGKGAKVQGSRGEGEKSPLLRSTSAPLHTSPFASSQEVLEHLEHANLFIIPLDGERRWYRYHHLFSDLLRQRLNQTQSELLPILHHRASLWYERNGLADEAIEHALHAEDYEQAAHLIEAHVDAMWRQGKHTNLRRWLAELPVELVFSKPQLCIFRAWHLFAGGQQDEAERFLQTIEVAHNSSIDPETELQKQARMPASNRLVLRGKAAAIRAFMAGFKGDVPAIIKHARQALEYLPERELTWRSTAAVALGDGYGIKGDMVSAYQARLEASKICQAAGNIYFLLVANIKLAMTIREQGRLKETIKICEQQMQIAKENGLSQTGVAGGLMAIWGEVLAELNDLEGAKQLAKKGAQMTEHSGPLAALGWSHLCLMRVLFSSGDLTEMEVLIQKMEKIDRESNIPPWITKQMATWQTRLWLAQDMLEAASQGVEVRGLVSAEESKPLPELDFFRLFEYIGQARVLIAQGRLEEAEKLLQLLLEAAETGERTTKVIEILLLQALAYQAGGDTNRAMAALERSLTLAEPGGFIRIFVDEGPPMAHLLYKALDRGIAPDYVRRLLQAFPIEEPKQVDPSESQDSESGYIEPLSEREIEVLQFIAEGLTNQEIATKLFLSLHTVKTHARNIYSKLNAHNRTEAVARARAVGILPST